jgi:hypothetical protein
MDYSKIRNIKRQCCSCLNWSPMVSIFIINKIYLLKQFVYQQIDGVNFIILVTVGKYAKYASN